MIDYARKPHIERPAACSVEPHDSGKAGDLKFAGLSKGPVRKRLKRKPKPSFPRKRESRNFSGFRVALHLPIMTITGKTDSQNCQTLAPPEEPEDAQMN
jgi:hypothetical protein